MEKRVDSRTSHDPRSWIGLVLLAVLAVMVAWKLLTSQWRIDLTGFSFADILSVGLALFAVLMSALFYFKANETSNAFYDNTYHFSQSMSEILARIEFGFGERLKHLDDGYAGIADKVNGSGQIQTVKEEVKTGEDAIKKAEQERDRLLDGLMKRAKLQDDEKQSLMTQMQDQEKQLNDGKAQLSFLRHRLVRAESLDDMAADTSKIPVPSGFIAYASEHIVDPLSSDFILTASPAEIRHRLDIVAPELLPEFVSDLRRQGWVDSRMQLTDKGLRWLRNLAAHRS